VGYHFRKWSKDGSLENLFKASILTVEGQLNLSELNLDGTHVIAKKGGESVAYQGRKRAKTTNILPITDKQGYILATTQPVAGNHNDAFELKDNLQSAFKFMKRLGLGFQGAYFNADSSFDAKAARKVCFNYGVVPNIPGNKRNRKSVKRGRKRYFNSDIYKHRFSSERTFAWIDKFRALVIRYERKDVYFLGAHFIAYSMINLRHTLADKKFH
jgi:transposase